MNARRQKSVTHDRLAFSRIKAAESLGISPAHLDTMTKQGRIPCVRIGNRVVYPVGVLEKWLADQATQASGGDGPAIES
jgi:hypothetical protein